MLRTEKGKSESILRKDIDFIKASEVSLMPSNMCRQRSENVALAGVWQPNG